MAEGPPPIFLAGFGHAHPEDRLTNADFEARIDTTDEWIRARTGIVERRVAPPDLRLKTLGADSVSDALERAGWDLTDIDVLLCSTSSPDWIIPPMSSQIADELGLEAVVFDVGAACSGFVFALDVGSSLLETGRYRRAAVCAAEKMSGYVDYDDRTTSVFFGDGSGTALLQTERPAVGAAIVDIEVASISEHADRVSAPRDGWFRQDGKFVFDFATEKSIDLARDVLSRHGLEPDDLRVMVGHQSNLRLLEHVADALGIDDKRHWQNVEWYGNQASAGVITALSAGIQDHGDDLADGDLILLLTVGAGFSAGAALLEWIRAE